MAQHARDVYIRQIRQRIAAAAPSAAEAAIQFIRTQFPYRGSEWSYTVHNTEMEIGIVFNHPEPELVSLLEIGHEAYYGNISPEAKEAAKQVDGPRIIGRAYDIFYAELLRKVGGSAT